MNTRAFLLCSGLSACLCGCGTSRNGTMAVQQSAGSVLPPAAASVAPAPVPASPPGALTPAVATATEASLPAGAGTLKAGRYGGRALLVQEVPSWAEGRVINDVAVPSSEKCIALTFDDGPSPDSTPAILDLLREYDAKATFFVVGSQLREYPKLGRAIADDGHAIGNHSWSHAARPRDPSRDVSRTDALIEREMGVRARLFRPPYGICTNGYVRKAKADRQAVLIWSTDTLDWKRPGANRIATRVIREAKPGGIVLMHDGGGDRRQTVKALRTILKTLQGKGYRFVTIPELLSLKAEKKAAPVAPVSGLPPASE